MMTDPVRWLIISIGEVLFGGFSFVGFIISSVSNGKLKFNNSRAIGISIASFGLGCGLIGTYISIMTILKLPF